MEILCTAVRPLCRADRHLRQGGREGHQFGLGYGYPHHCHPAADVGHRALRAARGRDKGDTASCLALPRAERGGDGAVVAVLLQGVADGRRVARGADRQAERRHHHLPVVPVSEGTGQPAGGGGRAADNGRKHPYVTEMKLLIIEDERELSASIVAYLSSENYVCEQAFTYAEALEKVGLYDYDCVLLDLMLPGGNGLDILREIRKRQNPVGVIIVSAKDSLDDKVRGLEIGADDYLAKPFHLPELSMRIYAIIRRREFAGGNLLLLAKIDNRQYGQMEDINLTRFLEEQASYLQSITGDIFFYEELTNSGLTVRANRTLLESLVNNLVVNAVRYNRPGGEIYLTVSGRELTVSNTSDEPALDDRLIFNRFYRPSEKVKGNGLGLAIVRAICEYHRWTVGYRYEKGRHRFTVRF